MEADSGPSIASSENSEDSREFISQLPRLSKEDLIGADEGCPICLLPLEEFLNDSTSPHLSLATSIDDETVHTGVTKIEGCGHVFCRQDLAEWIIGGHGSCPLCRHVFLEIIIPEEPESSDGGEYVPSSDLEDAEMEEMEYDAVSEVASDWHGEDEWVEEDSWLTTDAEVEPDEMETQSDIGFGRPVIQSIERAGESCALPSGLEGSPLEGVGSEGSKEPMAHPDNEDMSLQDASRS